MKSVALDQKQKLLAKTLNISESFLHLLLKRGLSEEDIPSFLNPRLEDMCSPFEIKGMREAADRLKRAIDKKERILIFGDYDCDGICAISVLMLELKGKTDVSYYIPNRNVDGYGLTVDALKNIVKMRRPDLLITVDCGITAIKEIEYLISEGIDVIVTDHHEPQAEIPDCIIVDPKIEKKGFYDFCGAGVAYKLVEAVSGSAQAQKYLDVVAIATIADVVPLRKDNRIIACFGLKQHAKSPRKGIKMLAPYDNLTSQDIMFKLAPRLNAAGRLNSAMKVVDLFLEDDYFLLRSLVDELDRDNQKRQEICEGVVRSAKQMLRGIDFMKTRIIVLYNDSWEAGVLGIAAARLAEEFKCPAVLFSDNDGEMKGSARSIREINIFELLGKYSDMFITFGGHAQAAGVSIRRENFDAFKTAINEEIIKAYPADIFKPRINYDMQLDMSRDLLPFAKELTLLEPTGCENPKPSFLIRADGMRFERVGLSPHIKCVKNGLELMGFSKFAGSIGSTRGEIDIDLTLGVGVFQNRVYPSGIIRNIYVKKVALEKEESTSMCLFQLKYEGVPKLLPIDENGIKEALNATFGTIIVCFSQEEYENLCDKIEEVRALPVCVGTTQFLNPSNCVLIAPQNGFDFSFFRRAIIAGRAMSEGYLKYISDSVDKCLAFGDVSVQRSYISDELLRSIFLELRGISAKGERIRSFNELLGKIKQKIRLTTMDFEIAMQIFDELGLISVSDRGNIDVSKIKTELTNSPTYRNTRQI